MTPEPTGKHSDSGLADWAEGRPETLPASRKRASGRSRPPEAPSDAAPAPAPRPRSRLPQVKSGATTGKDTGSARVITLVRTRFLLWASPRGDATAYEVSKAVDVPLQSLCATAPLCPGEQVGRGAQPGWIDPASAPVGECPYAFQTRGDCVRARNLQALEAALFQQHEVALVSNYLRALSFEVRSEEVVLNRVADGSRILHAHSKITESHDVRVMASPVKGELVLVRELPARAPRGAAPRVAGRSDVRRSGRARRAEDEK